MKKRIIPSLLLSGGSTNVCLSQQFVPWRTIGTLAQQLKLHIARHCDELLIINLNQLNQHPFVVSDRMVRLVLQNVDIPISYCGGISNQDDVSHTINKCFDKVFITSAFIDKPDTLAKMSSLVGTQSIGVCLPYKFDNSLNERFIWDYRNSCMLTNYPLEHYIQKAYEYGAGEIFLYSVDRDGTLNGLDEPMLELLSELNIQTPILMGGGAGSPENFSRILSSDLVQGVVAGSIFALTEETPETIRQYCSSKEIPMRII